VKSWKTFLYFLKAYPQRGAVMIFALTVAGILEGVGIAALLPLISILTENDVTTGGRLTTLLSDFFRTLGYESNLSTVLIFIVIMIIAKAVVTLAAITQVSYTSAHVAADLRTSFLQHLLRANWLHYLNLRSGASINALGMESQRAALAFKYGCLTISFIVQIIAYAALAFLISWQVTLAALGIGVMLVLFLGFLTHEARQAGNTQTHVYDRVLGLINDALMAAKPIKAMHKDQNHARMMQADIKILQKAHQKMEFVDQSIFVISEPLMLIFIACGLYFALEYNVMPVTELLFMSVLSLRLIMRLSSAQRSYQTMAANESALWSLRNKINSAAQAEEKHQGTKKPILTKGITVVDIHYSYVDRPVLDGVTLSLPVKKFHLIYGPSGAGKTTLVDLVTGLITPDKGHILIDSVPLSEIDMQEWRKQIGYVPQEVLLFHDTIYNNIALNDESLTRSNVENALKHAEAWDFVSSLEQGMDTIVGERGAKVSGGQRQRLALARAIVHYPQVLILDEATSALDKDTEMAVLKTVRSLTTDMMILAISHSQALMEYADDIYYLQSGKIVKGKSNDG
jgi:ATP-binding cassette subfamily C protein